VIVNLAVVVALPLAAGIALRCLVPVTARFLAAGGAQRAAAWTAVATVAALVALVAAEVRLSAAYGAVAVALLLTTSMRDFAVAAALAAAAFGPRAAAPLGLYGVAVLVWGTAAAGFLRGRVARVGPGRAPSS